MFSFSSVFFLTKLALLNQKKNKLCLETFIIQHKFCRIPSNGLEEEHPISDTGTTIMRRAYTATAKCIQW